MKPESILHADILDIIFENRNKEYGAYELRTHYKERLVRSLLIVLFFLITIWGLSLWLIPKGHHLMIREFVIPDTEIKSFVSPDKPRIHPARPSVPARVATISNARPTIVRDIVPVKPIPTVDELDINHIGTETLTGGKGDETFGSGAGTSQAGNAGSAASGEKEESILKTAEIMPEFPGGMEALKRFLSRNLHVPKDNLDPGEKVKVIVKFVIDKEGIVTDLIVTEHGGNEFDAEVMRVMKKMPQWKPGMQNGRKVAVYYFLPVTFQGPDEN